MMSRARPPPVRSSHLQHLRRHERIGMSQCRVVSQLRSRVLQPAAQCAPPRSWTTRALVIAIASYSCTDATSLICCMQCPSTHGMRVSPSLLPSTGGCKASCHSVNSPKLRIDDLNAQGGRADTYKPLSCRQIWRLVRARRFRAAAVGMRDVFTSAAAAAPCVLLLTM